MMKRIFVWADEYIARCDWKDLALLKFCLCAVGILIGVAAPKKARVPLAVGALVVFAVTYIPLMKKFIDVATEGEPG